MKIGIKEFRERLGEIARGDETVDLTDRGRVIGTYEPLPKLDAVAARRAAESIARWQVDLRAKGIEPENWLAELGLGPWGASLTSASDR